MKNVGKRIKNQGPLTTIAFLTVLIGLISLVLSILKVGGSVTEAGSLETSLVTVKNIFSKDGIKYLLNNYVVNFQLMQPLIYLVMSLISVSILESSGLINYLVKPFKKVKPFWITFLTFFISIILTFVGDLGYILLIPLVCSIYKILGRNPLLGMITVFLGVTIGMGAGVVFNYQDYLLSLTTTTAASNIDDTFTYNLFSNIYIMLFSTLILSIVGTISIEKLLSKKFKRYDYDKEVNLSKRAFVITSIIGILITLFFVYAIIPGLPLSGLLLNSSEKVYIAQIFSDTSALGNGLMLVILGISVLCGFIYGRISGNIRHKNDYIHCLTGSFENTGYILVVVFFASIMLGLLEWSNIPTVLTTNIVDLIGGLNFNGVLLVIIVFISILFISILIPTTITKWNLVAPVYVPLLMRANISPNFMQSIFMSADAVGKLFSPIYLYLIIMIGFLYKEDQDVSTSIFDTMKLMMPVILILLATNFIIVVGWYVLGIPIGLSGTITL
jgi:aminobenzoyl-glutamate transport protein